MLPAIGVAVHDVEVIPMGDCVVMLVAGGAGHDTWTV